MSAHPRDGARPQGGAAEAAVPRPTASLAELVRRHGPVAAAYSLPFVLILYLALRGGGYDALVRGEVGIAIWWIVLVGAAVGVLPVARVTAAGWTALALLGAFAAWTALGIGWSESSERSVAEVGRVAAYLGVLALALVAQGRDGARRTAYAVGAAIAAVGVLALLSRLHPEWFPANDAARFIDETGRRLGYPVNYWNGLAALIAIGMPLLVWAATAARHVVVRALAAASLPALAAAAYFTLSRGGAIEIAVGLGTLIALHPRRLTLAPALLVAGAGSAILVGGAAQRDDLADGLRTQAAASQGDEMLAMALVVCAGVALVHAAIALAARYEIGPRPQVSTKGAAAAAAIVAVIALVVAIAAGAPGAVSDTWEDFKQPGGGPADTAERFESASGNSRYQYWSSMVDAAAEEPLTGIGPGTFEYWWAREGTLTGFVRDAHSLYFEALGELGIVGLALIGGLVAFVLGAGVVRTLAAISPERRALLAALTAACFAFAAATAIDWVWELFVIPAAFLLLAAPILAPADAAGEPSRGPRPSLGPRIALAAVAVAAIVAIAIPLAGTASVRASQEKVRSAQLEAALAEARTARDVQPYSASASLQEALVLELVGDLDAAAAAAAAATEEEPTNFRTWLVLSRLEAERADAAASLAAYREARSLNPRSPLFAR